MGIIFKVKEYQVVTRIKFGRNRKSVEIVLIITRAL